MDGNDFLKFDGFWSALITNAAAYQVYTERYQAQVNFESSFESLKRELATVIKLLKDANLIEDAQKVLGMLSELQTKYDGITATRRANSAFKPRPTGPGMISGPDAAIMFMGSMNLSEQIKALTTAASGHQREFQKILFKLL